MHRYMRAIGFSKKSRKEIRELVLDSVRSADHRNYTISKDETMLAEFERDYAENLGITAAGEFDEEDMFHLEYFYPYLRGTGITSGEDISVERHLDKDSYSGVCDDLKVGISLIFYLQNKIPYVKAESMGNLPIKGTTVTLSALSVQGSIILPLYKEECEVERIKQESANRYKLLSAAKGGDENAIEMLTMEDMDTYTNISQHILKDDIYSMVDTCLMPYGVECELYSIVGEIVDFKYVTNHITEEEICVLTVFTNELTFDIAINIIDLVGEPQVGRRFKGVIWLQGRINFPEELN